jgi:uncharacterized membrane protein YqjE
MNLLADIKEKIREYVDTKLRLYQMSVEERVAELIANAIYLFLWVGIALLSLGFLLLCIVKTINYFAQNEYVGYGILAALCLLLLGMLSLGGCRRYIVQKTQSSILSTAKSTKHGVKDESSV